MEGPFCGCGEVTQLHSRANQLFADPIEDLPAFFNRLRLPLYAVVDSARDRRLLPLLEDSGCEFRILYSDGLASLMDGRGPYIVALSQGGDFLRRLVAEAWGKSWGIFLTSSADLAAVRRHLRRLLSVRLPDGRPALFRFYDPRILRDYLPTCYEMELGKFFGPLHAIYLESSIRRGATDSEGTESEATCAA
ncbi:hypothetical protein GMSM_45420 [Geomonas sp. Red276]